MISLLRCGEGMAGVMEDLCVCLRACATLAFMNLSSSFVKLSRLSEDREFWKKKNKKKRS